MSEDHDILIEIRTDLKNFIANFETHLVDDKDQFKKLGDKTDFLSKIVYGCIGVFFFIEIMSKFLK